MVGRYSIEIFEGKKYFIINVFLKNIGRAKRLRKKNKKYFTFYIKISKLRLSRKLKPTKCSFFTRTL